MNYSILKIKQISEAVVIAVVVVVVVVDVVALVPIAGVFFVLVMWGNQLPVSAIRWQHWSPICFATFV